MDEARRSVARVYFKWKNAENPDKKEARRAIQMVIPGIIVSVKDDKCLMIVDPSFFRALPRFSFYVTLPEANGEYGKPIWMKPTKKQYLCHPEFYGFVLKRNDYIKAAEFETSAVKESDTLYAFLFAREAAIAEANCAGHIIQRPSVMEVQDADDVEVQNAPDMEVLFHDCALHEYGHLGSPIFKTNGHLVGICYATQSRTHAWTVDYLKMEFDELFKNSVWSVTYIDPCPEGGLSSHGLPNQDMDPGNVSHHVAKRSKVEVSGCSSSANHAPAPLPSGVVTLGYKTSRSAPMVYMTGIILMCERDEGNEYTTFVVSSHKVPYDRVYVYFEPNKRKEGIIEAVISHHMLISIKDGQFHEPLTWSSEENHVPGYKIVKTISIMAGTKLNDKAAGPLKSLIGVLGLYRGQITTPTCLASTAASCTIESGTEKYFQFSCSFQNTLVNFKNIDVDRVTNECDSMVSAPVFTSKGKFVGIVYSSGNWPDTKTGMYSKWFLSIVEKLMVHFDKGWSKEKLKWSSAQSV